MSIKRAIHIFLFCIFLAGVVPAWAQDGGKADKGHKEEKGRTASAGNPSMLIDAKRMAITGNESEAEELLRKYTEKYPNDPNGHFELARLLAERKSVPEAISRMEEAVALNPGNIWYDLFLAELYQYTGNYADAVKIYDRIIKADPDNLDNYYQLASLYLSAGKFNDAVHTYDLIESKIGITEEISLQKQKIHLMQKDFQDAEAEMRKLIAAYPDETRYMAMLAELYMSQNETDKAYELYQQILATDPEDPYIHMTLADFYRKQGKKEQAFEELKLGFANPALDIDTKVTILLSFYNINQVYDDLKDEAGELSRILIATHPNNPKGYSIAGDLYVQDKKYLEARDVFVSAVALDSSKYVIWAEILRLDLVLEEYGHLLAYGKTAIELFPDQPFLYVMTGIASFQLKDYPTALDRFNRALKLVVSDNDLLAQIYMHLGDTYHALNNPEESDKAYDKSLQIRDNNAYVLNNYAYYLSVRNKDLEKAEQMSKRALALDPENSSFQDTYGWIMYKLGKYEDAKVWIGKALNDPEGVSAEVLEHYGDTLYRLGDAAGALEYWKRAKAKGEGSELLDKKIEEKKLLE